MNQVNIWHFLKKCMVGVASNKKYGGPNPEAMHIKQTRWDCSHSFVGHVTLSYDGVGCLYSCTVGGESDAHHRWLHGLVPTNQ